MNYSLEVICAGCGYVSFTWAEDTRHAELCDGDTTLPVDGIA